MVTFPSRWSRSRLAALGQSQIMVTCCDGLHSFMPPTAVFAETLDAPPSVAAMRAGWRFRGGLVLCPRCAQGGSMSDEPQPDPPEDEPQPEEEKPHGDPPQEEAQQVAPVA